MGLPIGWTALLEPEPFAHPGWSVDPADAGELPRLRKVPDQAHRLKAIGNAVVPAVGEWAARALLGAVARLRG